MMSIWNFQLKLARRLLNWLGHALGVVVQGAFLLLFDLWHFRQLLQPIWKQN